jgi:hypothetical protein
MRLDGLNATNDLEKSYLFASRFQKMYVCDSNYGNSPNLDHILKKNYISNICLSEDEIIKGLLQLNPNKGAACRAR